MPTIWEHFKNLFKEGEQSSPAQPFVHEMIERSEEAQADYLHWKKTLVRRRLIDWLSDQYAIFKVLPRDIDEALDFLNTPSSKGFVIHFYKTNYSHSDLIWLAEYFREQVSALDYRNQLSDVRTFAQAQWVETIERHYLKPRPDDSEGKLATQRYGNITIEAILRDDKPYRLKFQATTYQDRLFKDAESFHDLMQALLS